MLKSIILCLVFGVFCARPIQAKDPKTLVLIICSDNLPVYVDLQRVWRSYMHLDPEHFECYFIRAVPELSSDFLIKDDVIWSKGQESVIPGLLNKTLVSLEALLPRLDEFDYVLRANLSSFYVFPCLLDFLKRAPRQRFYSGIHHGYKNPEHRAGWVNGSGIIMSTDLAMSLIINKSALLNRSMDSCSNFDDVVIADFFTKNRVGIVSDISREIYSIEDWTNVMKNIPRHVFHFRILTPEPSRQEVDFSIHEILLQFFYNKTVLFDEFY